MRGFLHPLGADPTSFEAILDRILAGARPVDAFAYGATLSHLNSGASLTAINTPAFYNDRNTLLEQALDVIGRDTGLVRTHILIGDGRRGSAAISSAQFTTMRDAATSWISHGGTFVVGASLAPFQTVPTDPSGCHTGASASEDGQVCPLYAFIFVAPSDVQQVSSAVADVFQHIFIWPVPALPPSILMVIPPKPMASASTNIRWANVPGSPWIVRVRGIGPDVNGSATAELSVDTLSQQGRVAAAILRGQELKVALRAKALDPSNAQAAWQSISAPSRLIRAVQADDSDLVSVTFATHGAASPESIISLDLVPSGTPSWLADFDAKTWGDVVRTYGLWRVFSGFKVAASLNPRSVARYTFVVN